MAPNLKSGADWATSLRSMLFPIATTEPAKAPTKKGTSRQQASFSEQVVTNESLGDALTKHFEAQKAWLHPILTNLIDKVAEQEGRIDDLRDWVTTIEERMDKIEKAGPVENSEADNKLVLALKKTVECQRREITELQHRTPSTNWIADIRRAYQRNEDERRSRNVLIYGLTRGRLGAIREAQNFLQGKLGITPPIARAMWIGATGPLLVSLYSTQDKEITLKNCWKLKGTPLSVREDLSQDTRQERRRQLETFKKLREEGRRPQFRGPKLYVDGKLYMENQQSRDTGRGDEDQSDVLEHDEEQEDPGVDGGTTQ